MFYLDFVLRYMSTHLRHGVEQGALQPRYNVGQVGHEVLLVGERVHVADDLRGHLARLGAAVEEGALHHGHDERQRRRVDEVHELRVQQRLQARRRLVRRVLERLQQHGHDSWNTIVMHKCMSNSFK